MAERGPNLTSYKLKDLSISASPKQTQRNPCPDTSYSNCLKLNTTKAESINLVMASAVDQGLKGEVGKAEPIPQGPLTVRAPPSEGPVPPLQVHLLNASGSRQHTC